MMKRIITASTLMALLLLPVTPILAQLTDEQQKALTEYFETNDKFNTLGSKPLELLNDEALNDFFKQYGNALLVIRIANDLQNVQDFEAFKKISEEVGKRILEKVLPNVANLIGGFNWAKTGMELFKQFYFDPKLEQYGLDFYNSSRRSGAEPEEAFSNAKAWGHLRLQAIKQFREEYGDLPFTVKKADELFNPGKKDELLPEWEEKLEKFAIDWFETEYQKKLLDEVKQALQKEKEKSEKDRNSFDQRLLDLLKEKEQKKATTIVSIIVNPSSSQLNLGQEASFQAMATYADNHTEDVTGKASWSGGAGSAFKADKVGTFSITATYQGISGSGTITVTEPACPDENAHWDKEAKNCVCNEGFEPNEKLGKCINLDKAIDDVGNARKGGDLCDENAIRGQWQFIQQRVARGEAIFSGFEGRYQKFLKEISDQNSSPCQNNLIAVAFAGGSRDLEGYGVLVEEVKTVANDLIERVGVCPDLKFQLDYSQLTSLLSQVGRHSGQMKRAIADMQAQLGRFGCDENDVLQNGNQTADNTGNINVIGDGGSGGTEICGDNRDNDGDGLYDEDCAGQSGSNVLIYIFDCGIARDDVFGLSVTGQGNRGTTPVGGANYFSLSLPPGNYVATVTVISAPDNRGTFCITISEGGKVIGGGNYDCPSCPPQGAQIQVPFIVGQAGTSSAASLPIMNFDNAFPEEGMPMQREGNPLFEADLAREPEKMETRGKNPLPTKRQKPAEKRPD